jgi:formate-dependent nitrite reductase membrane component NrfD
MNEIEVLKAVESLKPEAWWEWQIPLYLFFGGIAAGLMVLIAARYLVDPGDARSRVFRLLAWLSPLLLSLGMLALWLDLEKRWHVMRFYLAFRPTAPMSWGAWILLAVYPFVVLFALSELPLRVRARLPRPLERLATWGDEPKIKRRIAVGTALVGAALGLYTGILLSSISARPLWSSSVLGPLFLVSGLSTAAGAMLLFRISDWERAALSRIDTGLLGLEVLLLGILLLGLATGGSAAREAGGLLLGGAYTASFWSFVVIGGLAVPLFVEGREMLGRQGSRWVVPVLILVGGLALRWILVAAGQTSGWQAIR